MIMRLISEPCSQKSGILSFLNWVRSMQACYNLILRDEGMFMRSVQIKVKDIIASVIMHSATVSVLKRVVPRSNAKIVLREIILN